MNYLKHYNALIERAKTRILEGYVEKHHIIPKCMGGTDVSENIVILTPEEHYVAHQLLIKIYPNEPKLIYAAVVMSGPKKYKNINNKLFGWLKRKNKVLRKDRKKETKPRKKRILTEEHKKKIGQAGLGRVKSDETKKLMSENIRLSLQKKKNELGYVRSYTPKRKKQLSYD